MRLTLTRATREQQSSGGPRRHAKREQPPRRFIAGADAIAGAEQKIADLKGQIEANRALSTSLAFD
jgi:hypothetical protein